MKRPFYESPKASKFKQFFWKAAGGDRELLERSTYSDQIKYMCLGGIIVATGIMASLAGGYAFYTIFQSRDLAINEDAFSLSLTSLSVIFGCLWGLMIFNLDRFIVSSTGVGDGTEAITWSEFKGAIPRLILGGIIAITISKPVEIRMFKSEIDALIVNEQRDHEETAIKKINKKFQARLEEQYGFRNAISMKRTELKAQYDENIDRLRIQEGELFQQIGDRRKTLELEVTGQTGNGASCGDRCETLKLEIKRLNDDLNAKKIETDIAKEEKALALEDFDKLHEEELARIDAQIKSLSEDRETAYTQAKKQADGLDGLLLRIQMAHEIAGFWISLFITLLFMAIELTPIFFKLMLIKSPYDFMKYNVEQLLIAEQGIQIHRNYHTNKQGQELDWIQHHHSERLLLDIEKLTNEKKSLIQAQAELTDYAISKYKEDVMKKIDADPQAYIKTEKDSTEKENESIL